jgi:hypothetical protein
MDSAFEMSGRRASDGDPLPEKRRGAKIRCGWSDPNRCFTNRQSIACVPVTTLSQMFTALEISVAPIIAGGEPPALTT